MGHFGGKGLAYILEKQNEFRLSVAFYQRLLDALDPKLLKQPSYILEIEYQNPDHHAGFNASEIAWGSSAPTPLIGGHSPLWMPGRNGNRLPNRTTLTMRATTS